MFPLILYTFLVKNTSNRIGREGTIGQIGCVLPENRWKNRKTGQNTTFLPGLLITASPLYRFPP